MKYERLTERDKNGNCHLWDDTAMGMFNALDNLAELEDKIESGELISTVQAEQGEQEIAFFVEHNAEVRKQAIKEFFQGLVADGVIPQEPTNYDSATLKIYIAHLEAENAELRARMEKAAEKVDEVKKIIEPTMYTSFCGFIVRWCTLWEHKELYGTQEAAEARLKEIKENNDDVRRI